MAHHFHTISYFVARKDSKRPLRIHQRRDQGAVVELMPILLGQGYAYGEPILNTPPEPGANGQSHKMHAADIPFVEVGDLILQTTRPPLDDVRHGDKKQVEAGRTDLEKRIFKTWRRYFDTCARSHVELTERNGRRLPAHYRNRRAMAFKQRVGAPYKELNALDGHGWRRGPKDGLTAVFVLRIEEAWPSGPGLLGVFGMDGTATQVWAYRVARDFPELLTEPGFVMAEIDLGEIPRRPTNLQWIRDRPVEIVLRVPS